MIDLKGKSIFVMTNPEMGWDCVVDDEFSEIEAMVKSHERNKKLNNLLD